MGRIINEKSIPYLENFFNEHKLFYVSNLPWQILNVETLGAMYSNNFDANCNSNVRYKWMMDKNGFFSGTSREKNNFILMLDYVLNKDNPNTLRQRRYLAQQIIKFDGITNNPIHLTIKPILDVDHKYYKEKPIFDLNNYESCYNFKLICHPGGTRSSVAAFLRKNCKRTFLYINKSHFDKMEFIPNDGVKEITHMNELLDYYEPEGGEDEELIYKFHNEHSGDDYKNKMKYHIDTESNVLKLWEVQRETENGLRSGGYLKTERFVIDGFNDSKNISNILTNQNKLNIYSNIKEVWRIYAKLRTKLFFGESYSPSEKIKEQTNYNFRQIYSDFDDVNLSGTANWMDAMRPKFPRKTDWIYKDEIIYEKLHNFFRECNKYFVDTEKECTFEFKDKFIEDHNNFKKIVIENEYKGFALWFDKDVLPKLDREVFEFIFFARNDIAISKTSDGKIAVINCEHEDWQNGTPFSELPNLRINDNFAFIKDTE